MTKRDEKRKDAENQIHAFAKREMESIGVSCESCAYDGDSGRCWDCDRITFDLYYDDDNNNEKATQ